MRNPSTDVQRARPRHRLFPALAATVLAVTSLALAAPATAATIGTSGANATHDPSA